MTIEELEVDRLTAERDARNAKSGYGWDTDPWVWVYSFERVDKPAGWPGGEGGE